MTLRLQRLRQASAQRKAGTTPVLRLFRAFRRRAFASMCLLTVVSFGTNAALAGVTRTELRETFTACLTPAATFEQLAKAVAAEGWQRTELSDLTTTNLEGFAASRLVTLVANQTPTSIFPDLWTANLKDIRTHLSDTTYPDGATAYFTRPSDPSVMSLDWSNDPAAVYTNKCEILLSAAALKSTGFKLPFDQNSNQPVQYVGRTDRGDGFIVAVSMNPTGVAKAIEHPFPFAARFGVFAQ